MVLTQVLTQTDSDASNGDDTDIDADTDDSTDTDTSDDITDTDPNSDADTDTDSGTTNGDDTDETDDTDDSDKTNGSDETDSGDETNGDDSDDGDEPATHTVTVTVADDDNEPLENIGVNIVTFNDGEPVESGMTDSTGEVQFELEDGEYEILIDSETTDYIDQGSHPIEISGSDETYPIMLSQPDDGNDEPGMYEYALTVEVVDQDGEPVEGETVEIGTPPGTDTNLEDYETGNDGIVRISFYNSADDDAVKHEIHVGDETRYVHVQMSDQTETFVVEQTDSPA